MEPSSFSYSVFRYVKDARRDISVPIGVALWSHDAPWVQVRFVSPHEKVSRVSKTSDFPYINLVAKRVKNWIQGEPLPYSQGEGAPNSDRWWMHLQKVLVHKVRVSEPRSIDSQNPDRDLETLYKEIVGGEPAESNARVDHLISKCLGDGLIHQLHRGELSGFAGKPVRVMRFYSGPASTVIVEGVNLTTERAADDTDELVGRLQRAAADSTSGEDTKQKPLVTIVGYLATEHGLNGEAYLKEWIEMKTKARAFDIQRETEGFREATQAALSGAGTAS
jgi:Protein of unknown function (DUF3037)